MDPPNLPCSSKKALSNFLNEWRDEIAQKHTILQLNDDCLYKIIDFLHPVDLCSFRETCRRFQTIADYGFEKKYKSFHLTPAHFSGATDIRLPFEDAKRLIRVFGGLITKLTIDQTHLVVKRKNLSGDPALLLPLLDRYCTKLRDLELLSFNSEILCIFASETDRLFANLHRLVIRRWNDEPSISCCVKRCVALKELEIVGAARMRGNWLPKYFESLESFTLEKSSICPLKIQKFFEMNQHLKNVRYDFADYMTRFGVLGAEPMVVLPVNLKRLEINFGMMHLSLAPMKSQILDYLANKISLEHLLLSAVDLTRESFENLCRMKNLKTLKLTFMPWERVRDIETGRITHYSSENILNAERCKKLADELPDLTEVHIMAYPNITFDSIKEFIVNSKKLTKIFFYRCITSKQTLTSKMILDLIEIRRKEEFSKGTLVIFLRQEDIVDINAQFERNEGSKSFFEHQRIIKLLSTEEF